VDTCCVDMRAWLQASRGQVLWNCDVSCDCCDHYVPKGLPIVARVVVVAAVAFVVCIVAGYSSPSICVGDGINTICVLGECTTKKG